MNDDQEVEHVRDDNATLHGPKQQPTGLPALPDLNAELIGVIPYSPEEMHGFHIKGIEGAEPKRFYATALVVKLEAQQSLHQLQGQNQTLKLALTVLAMRQGGVLTILEREANKVHKETQLQMQMQNGALEIRALVPKDKIIIVGSGN